MMLTSTQILKDANASKFEGFKSNLEDFMQPVFETSIGRTEAKHYGLFIQHCLKTLNSKVKSIDDVSLLDEVIASTVVCGKCYLKLLSVIEEDRALAVPSFLYLIIHSVTDNKILSDHVLEVSQIVIDIVEKATFPLPEKVHNVLYAFYSFLWKTSCNLLKEGNSVSLKDVLQIRKSSLLFLCYLPLKHEIVSQINCIISHYSKYDKKWIDAGTTEAFYDVFSSIIDKLKCRVDVNAGADTTVECAILEIQRMLIEYLLKVSDIDKASEVITNTSALVADNALAGVMTQFYEFSTEVTRSKKMNDKVKIDLTKLKDVNKHAAEVVAKENEKELLVVYASLSYFIQLLSFKSLERSVELLYELAESCIILGSVSRQLLLVYDKPADTKKGTDAKKDDATKKSDEDKKMRLALCNLIAYNRHLHLLHLILETKFDTSVLSKCFEVAESYSQYIEDSEGCITEKGLHSHMCNLGFICSNIGSLCLEEKSYEEAVTMYTIVVNQFYKCKQDSLLSMYEKLVECYQSQEDWFKASECIVEALTRVDDNLKQIATMWARLKREGINKENALISVTLNDIVEKCDLKIPNLTSRQILLAEYQAWKNFSRPQPLVEYFIVCELLDVAETPVQKAEAMISIATNSCITGEIYKDRSASELLNDAVILLNKNLPGAEISQAVACFTKYTLAHEDSIEQIRSDYEDQDIFASWNIQDDQRFTLEDEQINLPFLVRAIELWEKGLKDESTSPEVKKKKSTKKSSIDKPQTVNMGSMFDLEHHIDCLIMCATRLLTMKQPQLAERALDVAKHQITNLKDSRRTTDLTLCLTRALMSLGKYDEAETVIDAKGDNKKQKTSVNMTLVMSELYMLLGKSSEGVELLQSLLDISGQNKTKRVDHFLHQGTAKRLLSMGLCLPSAARLINSTNQYLLSLAFEAVHCHVSVLNFLTKNKSLGKNPDKWMMLNEALSSLLHLCQLCRLIGLPMDALCYLRAGLKISQGQGLPRWSCEFLFEMLSVQSLEADSEKALTTVDYLNCIINAEKISKFGDSPNLSNSHNQSSLDRKKDTQVTEMVSAGQNVDPNKLPFPTVGDSDCFGFQGLAGTPMKMQEEQQVKTPDRKFSETELDSGKKKKMKQLEVPECTCMKQKVNTCSDQYRHKLCMKAGVVLSDFLTQSGMKDAAQKLLDEVQSKFKLMSCFEIENGKKVSSGNEIVLKNGSNGHNGSLTDPYLLYAYLEASCIQAESFLYQGDYHKVHNISKSLQKLEQTGCLKSVLHSNILLTRLALCDATGHMLSLHGPVPGTELETNQPELVAAEDCMSEQIDMAASTRKKVSFGNESEVLIVTGTKAKTSRKKLLKEEVTNTPLKSNPSVLSTPKVSYIKKAQNLMETPGTNKMAALELIMASDGQGDHFTVLHENEEDVFFPQHKPITPRVGPKSKSSRSKVSSKCKTEPRNPKKKSFTIAEDPVDDNKKIACKLGELFTKSTENEEDDDINFPMPKPVTPKPVSKSSRAGRPMSKLALECQTEPRRSRGKKSENLNDSAEIKKVECKLDFMDISDNGTESTETNEVVDMVEKLTLDDNNCEKLETIDDKTGKAESIDKKLSESNIEPVVSTKSKSKLPKKTLKSSAKGKSKTSVADDSIYTFKDSSVKSLNERRKLLIEKARKNSVIEEDSENIPEKAKSDFDKVKNDVFDFDLEASPCVAKNTKVGKGKQTKVSQKGKKGKKAVVKKAVNNDSEEDADKENSSVPVRKRTTRGRRTAEEIETVRGIFDDLDEEMELDISLDELLDDFKTDSDDSFQLDRSNRDSDKLSESFIESSLTNLSDLNSDSIPVADISLDTKEIMRADRKTKSTRSSRTRGASKKIVENENASDNVETSNTKEESQVEDECSSGVEKMRSGCEPSMKALTQCLNSEDEPRVLQTERPRSDTASPCGADIISTLESLYERLCQFPPNPQHSDTCQMLALHYLDTNPRRAAFLLSDAMAVTFRHQVMLNSDRKARKDETGMMELLQNNPMFSKNDDSLETSIKAIPEDWCVAQLSVVSAGSSWKQMVLTRFVKDQAPVVLKLPGFLSPQGRCIVKEFSNILDQSELNAKIESSAEWWNVRIKLDADMLALIQRMEKHWLGIWRCALLPGKCRADILTRAQRDILKITQTELEQSYVGLLLLAEKTNSERELRQCIEHIIGTTIDAADVDKIITVLKKYSKCMVSHIDKQHTILILDKTIQHLPLECMSILSERSVSRMPCLSHLVTQLSNLQAQESSVFVEGVNPRHTFYILNPESDLPRTEEVFKEWFEREEGWKGVTGVKPKKEQFIEALTERDFLIYCGHGSGGRFFNSHEIEKLSARAVALLMGCSSGRLQVKGQLEASGMMISYFLAGCPSMVANLWNVTDKDIDKFTTELIQKWLSATPGTYLSREVQRARAVCKLKHLNGFAPVVYGLPVFIKNDKS